MSITASDMKVTDIEPVYARVSFNDDTISAGDIMDARNEAVADYIEFFKNDNIPADMFDVHSHLDFLTTIKNIDDSVGNLDYSDELVSEDYAHDYIREHLNNEFSEIMEYADGYYGSDWPGSYVEFDIDGAIEEKIQEADEVVLGGNSFYLIKFY